ncbi:hypothetical protein Taro_051623, partial [Colocasia esculenta]|nr:hypothetical protein [Colocasia esculenta]
NKGLTKIHPDIGPEAEPICTLCSPSLWGLKEVDEEEEFWTKEQGGEGDGSVEATRADAQFTWNEFKEHFNSKYFSEIVQERKASKFAALKQRNLTVAEYEAQFSRLARYANHLVSTERMKEKRFLNGLRPAYITQLAPLDIQTYLEMVKKAQLLEDATDLTDHIKGKMVKKEQTSRAPSRPTNGKKRPFSITDGPSQEQKPKVFAPSAPNNKPRCKHYDKLGHTTEECWRKMWLELWEMKRRSSGRRSTEEKELEQGISSSPRHKTLGFLKRVKGNRRAKVFFIGRPVEGVEVNPQPHSRDLWVKAPPIGHFEEVPTTTVEEVVAQNPNSMVRTIKEREDGVLVLTSEAHPYSPQVKASRRFPYRLLVQTRVAAEQIQHLQQCSSFLSVSPRDRRDWGGGGDDPDENTQRMIERIWESLTDIRMRMDQ